MLKNKDQAKLHVILFETCIQGEFVLITLSFPLSLTPLMELFHEFMEPNFTIGHTNIQIVQNDCSKRTRSLRYINFRQSAIKGLNLSKRTSPRNLQ